MFICIHSKIRAIQGELHPCFSIQPILLPSIPIGDCTTMTRTQLAWLEPPAFSQTRECSYYVSHLAMQKDNESLKNTFKVSSRDSLLYIEAYLYRIHINIHNICYTHTHITCS